VAVPDVGDPQIVTLTVSPADGTTEAALTVTAPDGTTTTPDATPSNGNATWSTEVTYTAAGIWTLKWVVTGTGRGAEDQQVSVAPTHARPRAYATTTDLADFLRAAPPLNAELLLGNVTRYMDDEVLLTAVYDVDEDDEPTDTKVIKALKEACCAYAKWWDKQGIDGEDAAQQYTSVSAGSISIGKATGTTGRPADPRVSSEAVGILWRAGLLGHPVRSC
jgi:hypothetical protein